MHVHVHTLKTWVHNRRIKEAITAWSRPWEVSIGAKVDSKGLYGREAGSYSWAPEEKEEAQKVGCSSEVIT